MTLKALPFTPCAAFELAVPFSLGQKPPTRVSGISAVPAGFVSKGLRPYWGSRASAQPSGEAVALLGNHRLSGAAPGPL